MSFGKGAPILLPREPDEDHAASGSSLISSSSGFYGESMLEQYFGAKVPTNMCRPLVTRCTSKVSNNFVQVLDREMKYRVTN